MTNGELKPIDTWGLIHRFGLHPKKHLGQNFIIDPIALKRIVAASAISPSDFILEIGSGLGTLTRELAIRARQVIAVELDESLIVPLQEVLKDFANVQIVQGNILSLNPTLLMDSAIKAGERYKVVANIPYYITSALLRHLLEINPHPITLILTIQREVADRLCATAGEMSLLALSVQVYGLPKIVDHIPAGAFYPVPKVSSSVVRISVYQEALVPSSDIALFFRLAKAGFSQKRKTLRNALMGGMNWKPTQAESILSIAQIDPKRRAETLSIDEWQNLLNSYKQFL